MTKRSPNRSRLILCSLLVSLLFSACTMQAAVAPTATGEAQVTMVSLATATELPTATLTDEQARAQRFQPLLLTLNDFPQGIAYSEPNLRDSTTRTILAQASFSDAVGYSFEKAGSDYLGGVTGFLDSDELVAAFDATLEENLDMLLSGFVSRLADEGDQPIAAEDEAYTTELDEAAMPADVVWRSDFTYANERLIRVDVAGFRRQGVGVYLLYVSSPTREPLIDFIATIQLLEQRINAVISP